MNDKTVLRKACFADLKSAYNSEENRIVKLAPQLTYKAVYPSNNATKGELGFEFFFSETVTTLQYFSNFSECVDDTKSFIEIIFAILEVYKCQESF